MQSHTKANTPPLMPGLSTEAPPVRRRTVVMNCLKRQRSWRAWYTLSSSDTIQDII